MSNDEILTGLNNAVSRGESLENAKQALIMAGYNLKEIEDSANQINMGVVGTIPQQKTDPNGYKPLPKTDIQKNNQLSQANSPTTKKKIPKIVIVLGIILVILGLGLGFFILFGPKILDALFGKA